MKQIKIKLGANSLAKSDLRKPIVVPNKVKLAIESEIYNLDSVELMVTIRNKMQNEVLQFKANAENGHVADISEAIKVGELEGEISSYANCKVTKTWRIPNIIVKQIEYEFALIPETSELKKEIGETKKAIVELVEQLKTNNILL